MLKKTLLLLFAVFLLLGCSKPDVANVSVTFNCKGGDDLPIQTLSSGSLLKETTPVNKGFDFAGWYYDENYQLRFNHANAINRDMTLYASWKPSVINSDPVLFISNTSQITSLSNKMVFDDKGNLFLSTEDGIYKITVSGTVSNFVKGNYRGISFDSNGNLFALKLENALINIDKIDTSGNATTFLTFDRATDLFFDKKSGNLFVNNFTAGILYSIDAAKNISKFASGYGIINDFTIDPFGNFYIESYSSVSKITPTGAVVTFKLDVSFGSGCITLDKDDNVYLALSIQNGNNGFINGFKTNIYKITF